MNMGQNPILHLDTNNGKGTVLLPLLVEMVNKDKEYNN
jgi:hypothetical protein